MTLANTSKCIICPPRHTQHKYAFDKCGPSTTVCRKFWNTLHGGFPARLGRHDPVGYEWTKTSPSCRHRLGGPLKHSPDPVYHYRSLWKIFASPTCFLSDRRCGELFRLLTVHVSFFSCWLYLSPSLLFLLFLWLVENKRTFNCSISGKGIRYAEYWSHHPPSVNWFMKMWVLAPYAQNV